MQTVQCWDFMKCSNQVKLSCPAFIQNSGRKCWLVAGTLCGGTVQGDHAQKLPSCKLCDFWKKIKSGDI
ncbi:MAG: hypothetical protein M0024_08225 [Nitrospiraceae bacterium]|nr:hypothetical protein [Nitrospiraceae bacterium]